jgi:hypothetical protein
MESKNKSNYRFKSDNLGRSLGWHVEHPSLIFLIDKSLTMNDFWLNVAGHQIGVSVHQNESDLNDAKVFSMAKNTLRSFVNNLKQSEHDKRKRN